MTQLLPTCRRPSGALVAMAMMAIFGIMYTVYIFRPGDSVPSLQEAVKSSKLFSKFSIASSREMARVGDASKPQANKEHVTSGEITQRLKNLATATSNHQSFVLATIQALNVSAEKKKGMRKTFEVGNAKSKTLLEKLAKETGIPRLQNLSRMYQQRFPDAIMIGAKKCGTSFTRDVICKHSQIAMYRGEVHFFDKNPPEKGLESYRKRMKYSFPDQITVEKTPRYWRTTDAPLRIYQMNPNVKLILLVREPACRILSDYHFDIRHHYLNTSLSFNDIFSNPSLNKTWNELRNPSLYDAHMLNWLKVFPLEQIMIIKNEDHRTGKVGKVLSDVEDFLGLRHELEVKRTGQRVCIRPRKPHGQKCFQLDESGNCKYEAKFHDYLAIIREQLRPHVTNFEKIVGRKFHWY